MGNDDSESKTVVGEVADVLNTEIAKRLYDDLVSDAAKEGGGLITDAVKTLRLLTYYPFRFCAITFDKIQSGIEEAKSRVPEDRQIGAHPAIVMPVLERIGYEDDDSILREMYINLLARAIDRERVSEAHPAFAKIIEQLSPDEAWILCHLVDYNTEGTYLLVADKYEIAMSSRLVLRARYYDREKETEHSPYYMVMIEKVTSLVGDELLYSVYLPHLESLNVLHSPATDTLRVDMVEMAEDVLQPEWNICMPGKRNASQVFTMLDSFGLTGFGELFAKACIPEYPELQERVFPNEARGSQ
ncbi:MAG: DUF4393 domain-containing protein [Candidatus Nealsonbacteria bacterium]|nr:DUF4393 domain-containing protein [Candidatus Nealsonbacteria bacterium]